ncbi:MAG: branched-chain amino acid ABC transporter permease [Bacillota bacterium]|nr:branched-chain amino acid ABC transporter permease [Bacillota bacterium]
MNFPLWLNLTLNGLVLGTLYFLTAAGLSLIFGLMHVLNLAHAALFTWGAYAALWTYGATGNFLWALLAGFGAGLFLGLLLEILFIRPTYGKGIVQILLTLGLYMVLVEILKMIWGPSLLGFPVPDFARGTVDLMGLPFARYRIFLLILGGALFLLIYLLLTRTRFGMTVRAGVENPEMVQALGADIRIMFSATFALGAALAAFGGAAAGPFFRVVWPEMGLNMQLAAFIVVVIGGMGSFTGSAVGALVVGLSQAYMGYFFPDWALMANVGLMALVLLWRPQGLFAPGR